MLSYPVLLGVTAWLGWLGRSDGPALSSSARGVLIVSAVEMVFFGLILALAWVASRASFKDLLLVWRPGYWVVPLGVAYSIGLRLAVAFVALGVFFVALACKAASLNSWDKAFKWIEAYATDNRPAVETLVDTTALRHNPAYFILTVSLVSFVVAGLREELWRSACLAGFKKLGPRWFGSVWGQMGAVCLTAVVFGLGHLPQGPIAVCLTAVLGVALGAIMVLHRSIWPAVIAHGAFDATTFALLPFIVDLLPHAH